MNILIKFKTKKIILKNYKLKKSKERYQNVINEFELKKENYLNGVMKKKISSWWLSIVNKYMNSFLLSKFSFSFF